MFTNKSKFSENERKMKREEFLRGINYLTEKEINANKGSFEDLKKMSPVLNEYNTMTHAIYLQSHPDLPEDEKCFHQQCIATLMEKEKKQVEEALKVFNSHPHDNHDN